METFEETSRVTNVSATMFPSLLCQGFILVNFTSTLNNKKHCINIERFKFDLYYRYVKETLTNPMLFNYPINQCNAVKGSGNGGQI